ncbi:MAG TPA: helix-turn-helix domain-containing protein [Iamia sp.]|nr:helix-turn-helix domain-containing protein [Iamia sp.]
MSTAPTRTRAPAMSVEDRRSAIVAAAVPLFLEGGLAITTREVAEAAGIAEGTIFRAFADKDELVEAVIASALDPTVADEALAAIDPTLPLAERLIAAVDVLRERVTTFTRVMALTGPLRSGQVGQPKPPVALLRLDALFAADADQLRIPPAEASHLLRGLIVANVHPSFHPGVPRSSAAIVDLFLHGVQA